MAQKTPRGAHLCTPRGILRSNSILSKATTQFKSVNDVDTFGLRITTDNRHYEKVGSEVKDITDDLPFEIPDSWVWCRLNDIIILISGTDLSPDKYNSNNKGIPYITGASNFINSILNINRWTEHPTAISNKGDLLITCKGTIGEMAYNNVGVIHIARQVMAIRSLYHFVSYIRILLKTYIGAL